MRLTSLQCRGLVLFLKMLSKCFAQFSFLLEGRADGVAEGDRRLACRTFCPHGSATNDGSHDRVNLSGIRRARRLRSIDTLEVYWKVPGSTGYKRRPHFRLEPQLFRKPVFQFHSAGLCHGGELHSQQSVPLPHHVSGDLNGNPSLLKGKAHLKLSLERMADAADAKSPLANVRNAPIAKKASAMDLDL